MSFFFFWSRYDFTFYRSQFFFILPFSLSCSMCSRNNVSVYFGANFEATLTYLHIHFYIFICHLILTAAYFSISNAFHSQPISNPYVMAYLFIYIINLNSYMLHAASVFQLFQITTTQPYSRQTKIWISSPSPHIVSNGCAITMQKIYKFLPIGVYLQRVHLNGEVFNKFSHSMWLCSAHFIHYYFCAIDCISISIITIYWTLMGL